MFLISCAALSEQLMVSTTYLGWRESKADEHFQGVVMDMTRKLISYTKPEVTYSGTFQWNLTVEPYSGTL